MWLFPALSLVQAETLEASYFGGLHKALVYLLLSMYWKCVAAKIDFLEHLNDSKEPLKISRSLVWDENSATFKSSRCLLTATEEKVLIEYHGKIVNNCSIRGFLRKISIFEAQKGIDI